MSVGRRVDLVVEHRDAGTLLSSSDGVDRDWLEGLLWELNDRSQLDRVVDGLVGAVEVAGRAERLLSMHGPAPLLAEGELVRLARACVGEWVGLARRRGSGPVAAVFERVGGLPVGVASSVPDGALRLNGSGLGFGGGGALLSAGDMELVFEDGFELLGAELDGGEPRDWFGVEWLFRRVVPDDPMVGGWLLSPVGSWLFDFDPYFGLWSCGAGLWVSGDGVWVVPGTALWRESLWGLAAPVGELSVADEQWAAVGGPGAREFLAMLASRIRTGSPQMDASEMVLLSLPESILVEGGWRILEFGRSPGIDVSVVSRLDYLMSLTVRDCGLESFDIDLPPGLQRLLLPDNELGHWPAGLVAPNDELTYLKLSDNKLPEIPDEIAALQSLEQLRLDTNALERVSPAIGSLKRLETLSLRLNRGLESLPKEILQLPEDCYISLSMTSLPESILRCRSIGELRVVWERENLFAD